VFYLPDIISNVPQGLSIQRVPPIQLPTKKTAGMLVDYGSNIIIFEKE
jgi:hypothetical protein